MKVKRHLKMAGRFKVSVRQIDPTSLITVLQHRDSDLYVAPWSGRCDPDGNMFNHFTQGRSSNSEICANNELTTLLQKARSVAGQAKREALYQQAQRLLAEKCLMLFLHFSAIIQTSCAKLS